MLKEPRINVLQWKLLHNIYPTALFLKKIGKYNSDCCKYCNMTETIEHFFATCSSVTNLWSKIELTILLKTNLKIKLETTDIMFGFFPKGTNNDMKDVKLINALLLIGKLTISKYKYGKYCNILSLFEKECNYRKIL